MSVKQNSVPQSYTREVEWWLETAKIYKKPDMFK